MAVSQIAASASNADVPDNDYIAKHKPLPIRIGTHLRRYWQLWLMALPAMVFVFIFAYIPMYGIQLAFREFVPRKGLTGGTFVGLKYFNKFFQSPQFANLMRNTISISLWTLVMGFICPIILALLINQLGSKKIKGFVQTITYMPHFISTVVIVSMISIFLNPTSGFIGRFLNEDGKSILGDPNLFTPIYWITEVWQHCGWNSIIYLAALAGVDTALYEAAKMDGAESSAAHPLRRHPGHPAYLRRAAHPQHGLRTERRLRKGLPDAELAESELLRSHLDLRVQDGLRQ